MDRNPNKRQIKDLNKKAEKIGDLLNLKKVASFNMAWQEPRINLEGGGECYPLIDVLERLAEMVNAPVKDPVKKGRKKKVIYSDKIEGTTEV